MPKRARLEYTCRKSNKFACYSAPLGA
jgi:hypothetical protein